MRQGPMPEFQRREERSTELARDVVAASFLRQAGAGAGEHGGFFFDRYLFMTKPTILRRLASLLSEMVAFDIERLAGTEPGSIAVATALSLETGVPLVVLHEDRQSAGAFVMGGELYAGERVLLVEDVVMSGRHAASAAARLVDAGASIVGVLAVIDRQEGGAERLSAAGYPLAALYELGSLPIWSIEPGSRALPPVGSDR